MLCGYGRSAWSSLTVKGNRTLTVEVTAEDEQGFATTAKAMPVIGVWNATDRSDRCPEWRERGMPSTGSDRDDDIDDVHYASGAGTSSDRESARRRPARLQLSGPCALCRFGVSPLRKCGRRRDHDYGDRFPHGECGLGQRRRGCGIELDCKHHCGAAAFSRALGSSTGLDGECHGRRPVDRRDDGHDRGTDVCSAGPSAKPAECAGDRCGAPSRRYRSQCRW